MRVVQVDQKWYFLEMISKVSSDGEVQEPNLQNAFGRFYDDFMDVMITDKYQVRDAYQTIYYGLLPVDEVVKIISK